MSTRLQIPAPAAATAFVPPATRPLNCRQSRGRMGCPESACKPTALAHAVAKVRIHQSCAPGVQPKLTINEPGDKYEQEADRVADEVMRMPDPAKPEEGDFFERAPGPSILRKCAECEEQELRQPIEEEEVMLMPKRLGERVQRQPMEEKEEELQAKELPCLASAVTPHTQARVDLLRGKGEPLSKSVRGFFERCFGHDFSKVRIHADTRAAETTHSLRAKAFTLGSDIAFTAGAYSPETHAGRHLLAHELTHVIQQNSAAPLPRQSATGRAFPSTGPPGAPAADGSRVQRRAVHVRQSVPRSGPRRVQRQEHGTYVSRHGDAVYLDAGYQFYRTWGHPNVRRVNNMLDVLSDLDRARGTIHRFRIVSHGSPLGLELGLLPEISPDWFGSDEAKFTTAEKFREQFVALRLLSDTFFDRILAALRNDAATAPLLTKIGVGFTDPAAESPQGILLRAIAETQFLADVQLDTGGRPNIANRAAIEQFNRRRRNTYTRVIVRSGANRREQRAIGSAIRQLIARLPGAMASAGIVFPTITQGEANTLADNFIQPGGAALEPELSRSISEGADGTYLRRLRSVRAKIDSTTHVEIRGCNVGESPALMDEFREYFGGSGNLPSMSAPVLYQYYFRLSFETFGTHPDEDTRLQDIYNDPDSGLAKGFEDRRRILAGEMTRVVNDRKLSELAARYGHNTARLRKLNPEITDPDNLSPGDIIWLVQRSVVSAGRYGSLDKFCQDYLGNQYLWPTVWAANPGIANAADLDPGDQITIPANLLTPPIASAPPSFADLQSTLRAGTPIVALNPTENRPYIYLDNRQRAAALAAWLAVQRFDPRGRSVAALTRLYAGRRFARRANNTYLQLLSHAYPQIVDPIFPEDTRYDAHIIQRR